MNNQLYTDPGIIRTYTGQYINVFQPEPQQIHLEDIAHALSLTCRWGSHAPFFYSVADHCINVATHLAVQHYPPHIILEALLHDAAEAYLLDLPSPIKVLLPDYRQVENRLLAVIYERFQLPQPPISPVVKAADKYWLEKEWQEIILQQQEGYVHWPGSKKQQYLQAVEHHYACMKEAQRIAAAQH